MGFAYAPDALGGVASNQITRIVKKIDWLWLHRREIVHVPLTGAFSGYFRLRVGDYRVIYTYDPDADDMYVRIIGHRKDIYHDI